MQRNNNSNGTPGVQHACAACKHQRKKCNKECILAGLFPADRSREFQAVHKVFGVSNVSKIVRGVREEDRRKVADSLVWEAFCRQRDPVLGPYGEFRRVHDELKLYKSQIVQQGGIGALMGWNVGNIGINVNNKGMGGFGVDNGSNALNNYGGRDNGNLKVHHELSGYGYGVQNAEKLKQEKEIGSVLLPLQEHSMNDYNQQHYYLPGQFSPINGKTMESAIWESRS